MKKDLRVTPQELVAEIQSMDRQLFQLAAERVAGRKKAEYIEELEARLSELEMRDEDASDDVPSDDQPEQEK